MGTFGLLADYGLQECEGVSVLELERFRCVSANCERGGGFKVAQNGWSWRPHPRVFLIRMLSSSPSFFALLRIGPTFKVPGVPRTPATQVTQRSANSARYWLGNDRFHARV